MVLPSFHSYATSTLRRKKAMLVVEEMQCIHRARVGQW